MTSSTQVAAAAGGTAEKKNSPLAANKFFAWTFLVSLPFYLLNAIAFQCGRRDLGEGLIAAFTVTPLLATCLLEKRKNPGEVLRRCWDWNKIPSARGFLVIGMLPPLLFAMTLAARCLLLVLRVLEPTNDEPLFPTPVAPLLSFPVLFPFCLVLAAFEEAGWMGCAYPQMTAMTTVHAGGDDNIKGAQQQPPSSGWWKSALKLGIVWALWHVPFFAFLFPPDRAVAEALTLVAARIVMVRIYRATGGCVFSSVLFHAADNTAMMLFPDLLGATRHGKWIHCTVVVMLAAALLLLLTGGVSSPCQRLSRRNNNGKVKEKLK